MHHARESDEFSRLLAVQLDAVEALRVLLGDESSAVMTYAVHPLALK